LKHAVEGKMVVTGTASRTPPYDWSVRRRGC